jgi:hypothetical protein
MKKKIINTLLLSAISICVFLSQSAVAEVYELPGTPQFTGKRDANGRVQYAKTLISFLNKVDASIPSLSPSQMQWLERERGEYKKSNNHSRYREVMNTKEYQLDTAKNNLAQLISTLHLIIEKPPLKVEMYLWSLMMERLMSMEFYDSLYALINEFGIVDKKLFYSDSSVTTGGDLFYLNNGEIPAAQILRNIIQPYLREESDK